MESWRYGDPAKVYERTQREERRKQAACGKCVHRVSMGFGSETHERCTQKRRTYGYRCWYYEEKQ